MEKLSFYHLLDAAQIKDSDINLLIDLAEKYRQNSHQKNFAAKDCEGLIAATLFFEASTRTRMSFESAMLRLGGNNITLENGETSSVKKGETLTDTGRIVSNYADIIIVRHPETGSVAELAKYSSVPVINAGDGTNQHPSQSLADLYTIFCEKKRLDNLKIGVLGDLKHGRTVHSLLTLLSRYASNSLTLISHPSLGIDAAYKQQLSTHGCKIIETYNLENSIGELDILYVTRIQQERFQDIREYEKVKNLFHVNSTLLQKAKKNLTILHPLPRVNEIAIEVDFTDQARYFAQANYAVYIRMALLYLMTRGNCLVPASCK